MLERRDEQAVLLRTRRHIMLGEYNLERPAGLRVMNVIERRSFVQTAQAAVLAAILEHVEVRRGLTRVEYIAREIRALQSDCGEILGREAQHHRKIPARRRAAEEYALAQAVLRSMIEHPARGRGAVLYERRKRDRGIHPIFHAHERDPLRAQLRGDAVEALAGTGLQPAAVRPDHRRAAGFLGREHVQAAHIVIGSAIIDVKICFHSLSSSLQNIG